MTDDSGGISPEMSDLRADHDRQVADIDALVAITDQAARRLGQEFPDLTDQPLDEGGYRLVRFEDGGDGIVLPVTRDNLVIGATPDVRLPRHFVAARRDPAGIRARENFADAMEFLRGQCLHLETGGESSDHIARVVGEARQVLGQWDPLERGGQTGAAAAGAAPAGPGATPGGEHGAGASSPEAVAATQAFSRATPISSDMRVSEIPIGQIGWFDSSSIKAVNGAKVEIAWYASAFANSSLYKTRVAHLRGEHGQDIWVVGVPADFVPGVSKPEFEPGLPVAFAVAWHAERHGWHRQTTLVAVDLLENLRNAGRRSPPVRTI